MDLSPPDFAASVADRISTAIAAAGISVRAIAEKSGIPRVTLIRRLSGRSPFTVSEIAALAEVLGTRPAVLLLSAESAA